MGKSFSKDLHDLFGDVMKNHRSEIANAVSAGRDNGIRFIFSGKARYKSLLLLHLFTVVRCLRGELAPYHKTDSHCDIVVSASCLIMPLDNCRESIG